MAGIETENFDKVEVRSAAELHDWLSQNHAQDDSVWLVTFKKSEGDAYLSREEVLDELVAFGWIDGIRRQLDKKRTMQLISPRKTQYWAKSYKERVARLIKEGRMEEPGRRSVEEGEANGLWSFMDDVDALIVPSDLESALLAHDMAETFAQMAPSYRRNVLRWLKLAKTDKTRVNRIEKIAAFTSRGEKIPQM